jgi:anaerobic magnesium-protoporphyrin IX monomethyl ester cyclase
MKISLISPYPDVTAFGVRTLSAHLRKNGHSTQLIFLPDPLGDDIVEGMPRYKEAALDQVASLCRESDLIGISLMTNFFHNAVQITGALKRKLVTPVIWGGVHPTIRPEECLEHANMVCIGEGEDSTLELLNKMARKEDVSVTMNIWSKRGTEIVKNPLSPLPRNLDVYPMPDYSMEDHHIMLSDRVVPLTHQIMENVLRRGTVSAYLHKAGYQTMTSRGCPFNCAYCINDTIARMYGGKGKLRWRSIAHVMEELVWVKKNMPYINYIWLSDDEFMARKPAELEDFSKQYKEKIGLPFSCLVSPLSVTEEKMAMLVDAGLVYVQMGIESGSAHMQEIFNRKHMTNEKMLNAARIVNKFKDRMFPPSYDFLLDVPVETDADRIESLRLISELPKPYHLQPFTVILYPGTKLYDMAKAQGLIKDERKEIYNKTYSMHEPTYLNLLIMFARNGKLPGGLLRFLISTPVMAVLNSRLLHLPIKFSYLAMRGLHRAMKGRGGAT